jgi:hypothetical protein
MAALCDRFGDAVAERRDGDFDAAAGAAAEPAAMAIGCAVAAAAGRATAEGIGAGGVDLKRPGNGMGTPRRSDGDERSPANEIFEGGCCSAACACGCDCCDCDHDDDADEEAEPQTRATACVAAACAAAAAAVASLCGDGGRTTSTAASGDTGRVFTGDGSGAAFIDLHCGKTSHKDMNRTV